MSLGYVFTVLQKQINWSWNFVLVNHFVLYKLFCVINCSATVPLAAMILDLKLLSIIKLRSIRTFHCKHSSFLVGFFRQTELNQNFFLNVLCLTRISLFHVSGKIYYDWIQAGYIGCCSVGFCIIIEHSNPWDTYLLLLRVSSKALFFKKRSLNWRN